MRLIGFGLLAFLLAGVALFLSNSQTLRRGAIALGEVALGPRLVFEAVAKTETHSKGAAVVHWARPSVPLILSGLPAYQGATFYMPIDARPTSGYLQIDATVQVLAGVEGVLRISIGNTKRAELLLHPGEAGRSLRIPLTDQDIARERLVVSFSLQGEGPHTPCGIDEAVEAIVEIETTSAIFLQVDGDLISDRDHILVAGRRARLDSSAGNEPERLLAARAMLLSGVAPEFQSGGLTAHQATRVAKQLSTASAPPQLSWSRALADDAAVFGMRRFFRSHSWRLKYDMIDAQDLRLPKSISLQMVLGQLPNGGDWHIAVTLNGRHVDDRFVGPGKLQLDLPLSPEAHHRSNVIEISASVDRPASGVCDRGPELIAEISSGTKLVPGPDTYDDPVTFVLGGLKGGWNLTTGALSDAEALIAATLLAEIPTPDTQYNDPAVVRILPRGTALARWSQSSGTWVAQFDAEGRLRVEPSHAISRSFTSDVALLIDLSGVGT